MPKKKIETKPPKTIRLALRISLVIVGLLAVFAAIILFGSRMFVANIAEKIDKKELWQLDRSNGNRLQLTHDLHNYYPRVSPDGATIAFFHRNTLPDKSSQVSLRIFHRWTQQFETLFQSDANKSYLDWSPDSKTIYFQERLKNRVWADIRAIEIRTGLVMSITQDQPEESDFKVSPDGKWIAFLQKKPRERQQAFIIPLAGDRVKTQITHAQEYFAVPLSLAWSRNSKEIGYTTERTIEIIDPAGKHIQTLNLPGLLFATNIFFHPQDKNLLFFKARTSLSNMDYDLVAISRVSGKWMKVAKASVLSTYDITPDAGQFIFDK